MDTDYMKQTTEYVSLSTGLNSSENIYRKVIAKQEKQNYPTVFYCFSVNSEKLS